MASTLEAISLQAHSVILDLTARSTTIDFLSITLNVFPLITDCTVAVHQYLPVLWLS